MSLIVVHLPFVSLFTTLVIFINLFILLLVLMNNILLVIEEAMMSLFPAFVELETFMLFGTQFFITTVASLIFLHLTLTGLNLRLKRTIFKLPIPLQIPES